MHFASKHYLTWRRFIRTCCHFPSVNQSKTLWKFIENVGTEFFNTLQTPLCCRLIPATTTLSRHVSTQIFEKNPKIQRFILSISYSKGCIFTWKDQISTNSKVYFKYKLLKRMHIYMKRSNSKPWILQICIISRKFWGENTRSRNAFAACFNTDFWKKP